MNNKIVTTAITLTVLLLLCATVVVPVISDAQNAGETYTNTVNDAYPVGEYSKEDTIAISYVAGNTYYTVNGTQYSINDTAQFALMSDAMTIQAYPTAQSMLQVKYEGASAVESKNVSVGASSSNNCDITLSNGALTGTINGTTVNMTYTKVYALNADGEYISAYLPGHTYSIRSFDDVIYGGALVTSAGSHFAFGQGDSAISNGQTYEATATLADAGDHQTIGSRVDVGTDFFSFALIPHSFKILDNSPGVISLLGVIPLMLLVVGIAIAARAATRS